MRSRLPDVGTTIFTIMSKMALDFDAINLSQGFPDFSIDPVLADLVRKSVQQEYNQYAPMPGSPILQEAIAKMIYDTQQLPIHPEFHITITSGATEGIYATLAALLQPGEEVIVFDPAYDAYDPAIRLNGGVPVHINLYPPSFEINWTEVESHVNSKTRLILINNPHNPTGQLLRKEDLQQLERLVEKHNLLVLSDEVYDQIVFDGYHHHSILESPLLRERGVAVYSFGKMFHLTGWRVGYTIANKEITAEIRKAHQFITFSVTHPMQVALAEYLSMSVAHYQNVRAFYQEKRDLFLTQLEGSPFKPIKSFGTYFQLVSYEGYSSLPELEMAYEMTQKHRVACIPISVFYKDKLNQQLLRFCFCKRNETLIAAGRILKTM